MNRNLNISLGQSPVPYTNDENRKKTLANNLAMAGAYADPRSHLKNLDRPGVSRNEGTLAEASIRGANEYAKRYADAVTQDQDARQQAGQIGLDNALNMEMLAQQGAGLAENDRYAELMAQLTRQQMAQGFMGNILGGLMGGSRGMFG